MAGKKQKKKNRKKRKPTVYYRKFGKSRARFTGKRKPKRVFQKQHGKRSKRKKTKKIKPRNQKPRKVSGKKIVRRIKRIRKKASGIPRYYLNRQFQYIDELRDLILKTSPEGREKMTEQLFKLGRVKLAIATGIFLNNINPEAMSTDLFIVGDDINRRKLRSFLKSLEADVGKEVRYVVMEKEEFQYRIGMFDRFIRVLLEGPHEKLINRLGI